MAPLASLGMGSALGMVWRLASLGLRRRLASLGLGSALLWLGRRLALLVDPMGLPPLWVGLRAAELKRRVERGA